MPKQALRLIGERNLFSVSRRSLWRRYSRRSRSLWSRSGLCGAARRAGARSARANFVVEPEGARHGARHRPRGEYTFAPGPRRGHGGADGRSLHRRQPPNPPDFEKAAEGLAEADRWDTGHQRLSRLQRPTAISTTEKAWAPADGKPVFRWSASSKSQLATATQMLATGEYPEWRHVYWAPSASWRTGGQMPALYAQLLEVEGALGRPDYGPTIQRVGPR